MALHRCTVAVHEKGLQGVKNGSTLYYNIYIYYNIK